MAGRKPLAVPSPNITAQKSPDAGPLADAKPKFWVFSFRNWSEVDDFGLPKRPRWYASVFGRLRELGKIPLEQFLGDKTAQDARRYHEIDWNAPNIPLKRAELTWVAPEYLKNEIDYPFVQFHVSKAVGRVIGFWDEAMVFNIVLFDPMHNLQPSKHNSYQVRPAPVLNCEFTSLLRDVAVVKDSQCNAEHCDLKTALTRLPTHTQHHEVLILPFMEGTISAAEELVKNEKAKSLSEIFERGVVSLLDDAANPKQ